MKLKVIDNEVECNFTNDGTLISKHTGRQIRKGIIDLKLFTESDYNYFNEFLSGQTKLKLFENDKESKWLKMNNSSNYTMGRNVYKFSINVLEDEMITIDSLEIEGMSLVPEFYSESISNEAIIIEGIVKLNNEIIDKFRSCMLSRGKYFDVIRHGIGEDTRKMRFGRILDWCPSDSEEVIYQGFNLVENVYDNVKSINNPEIERTDKLTLENILLKTQMKFIFDKLIMKGIISKDEQDAFEKSADGELKMHLFDYTKSVNINELKDKMEES